MSLLLGPALIFIWTCALGVLLAFRRGRPGVHLVHASLAVGVGLATYLGLGFGAPAFDAGEVLLEGALHGEHFSTWIDALAALLAGLLSLGARKGRAVGVRLLAPWVGALSVSLAAHGTELTSLVIALEVAALAGLSLEKGDDVSPKLRLADARRRRNGQLLFLSSSLLGLVFIFGATADLDLAGLSTRTAKVFNQWGGAQRWYGIVMEDAAKLPSGFLQQARGKVVTGMASASLLLPGVIFLAVGVLGRFFAPGPVSAPSRAFARLVAFVILARVFVAVLYTPRMVNEPYGWVGPLPSVAVLWVLWGAWSSRRARGLRSLGEGLGRIHLGVILILLIAAANYYGHRALADGPVAAVLELAWAQRAGDDALAAALSLVGLSFTASAARWIWCLHHQDDDGFWTLDGLVRGQAVRAWSLVLILGALSALPFSPLFPLLLASLRSVIEHSQLRLIVPVAALGLVVGALSVLALLRRIMWGQPPPPGPSSGIQPHEGVSGLRRLDLCLMLGLAFLLVGLAPSAYLHSARLASAGLSQPVGGKQRREWMQASRARWSGGASLAGLAIEPSEPDDD